MKQLTLILAAFCLTALPYMAQAQNALTECSSDTSRYCSQVSGAQNVQSCLIDHQKEISDACYSGLKAQLGTASSNNAPSEKAAAESGTGNGRAAAQACKADAESFCKGVEPGGGRVARCLIEHKSELTEPCKAALATAAKNRRHKDQ